MQNLDNARVVELILTEGSDEQFELLYEHLLKKYPTENIRERLTQQRDWARQRMRLIAKSRDQSGERTDQNLLVTQDEYEMGCYKEVLEPQVREAVLALKHKGYVSYESGFSRLEDQEIVFTGRVQELETFILPEEVTLVFAEHGAEPYIKPDAIGFHMRRLLEDDELAELWAILADAVPATATEQPPMNTGGARNFRRRQDELRVASAEKK